MIMFFIITGGLIIKCVGGAVPASCETVSPLVFGGLASAGVLELIFEVKGFISIFINKGDKGDK